MIQMIQETAPPSCLEVVIELGKSIADARHLSGRRRQGWPLPRCPGCGSTMFCVFSFDGRDPLLEDSPFERGENDLELFVCPQPCYCYQTGYFSRERADHSIEFVFHDEGAVEPFRDIVYPLPVAPVKLLRIDPKPPDQEEIYGRYLSRRVPPGYYFRISPYFLWGGQGSGGLSILGDCPFCGDQLRKAMVIDSLRDFGLFEKDADGTIEPTSLLWGDADYLGVSHCRRCRAFGYRLMC